MKGITLQKFLQQCGLASRRDIRQWIHEGRFKVNRQTVDNPNHPIQVGSDQILFGKKPLTLRVQHKRYFIFNKPVGVVSTLADPEGRPTVRDYIGRIRERVYPVGRLDFHSDGLMLLTNDGQLANFILAARHAVPKTYLLKIKGVLGEATKRKLEKGIFLEGERLNPFSIEAVRTTGAGNSWLRVTITEGKKHILRNAFKYSGHPVEKLRRLAIGTFTLGRLPLGEWRELRPDEIIRFKRQYRFEEDVSR
jgi:23S rRNA pseudouridine2605 synthase